MSEGSGTSFGEEMRHRIVEEFAVSFYNGTLKPNLAEKNPVNGRDIEYLMDGQQFEKTRRTDIWSYGNAIGTGYQYRVVYKDKRYADLERLLGIYSGTARAPEEDREVVVQNLYEIILQMIKEGRLPKTFRVRSAREIQEEKLLSMVEELGRSMDELGRRVRELEEKLAANNAPLEEASPPPSVAPSP